MVCANSTRREKKRFESRYECAEYNVRLYISNCFQDYHTSKYFVKMVFDEGKHELIWRANQTFLFLRFLHTKVKEDTPQKKRTVLETHQQRPTLF